MKPHSFAEEFVKKDLLRELHITLKLSQPNVRSTALDIITELLGHSSAIRNKIWDSGNGGPFLLIQELQGKKD
jgi:hypothetical protein